MAGSTESDQPDLLEKLSAMGWQDLILPVFMSGSLMVLCYFIGHYQFSIIWILLLTLLYMLKTRYWIARQEARIQMRKQILRERGALGVVGASNKEIPSWLKFPDSDRVEWLNQMLQQLWPYISEYSANFMREFIEPQVVAQMPAPMRSFRFLDIDMGDTPARVSGLKVYTQNVGRDKLIVDLDIAYAGDAEFKVKCCGFTGGMNELVCSGRVRCIFQPLIPQPPMVAAVNAAFVELPHFDFNLTGMGDFLQLPLLNDAIRSIINTQMANMCNSMIIPLVPEVNINRLFVPLPDGVIRIKVVEAGNLENKDMSFIVKDKSDPYCELQLGSQLFRTRTINNNLDPKFDEYFEAVVDQVTAQKLRIQIFDHDTTGSDEELGNLSIPMTFVEKSRFISKWFNLESCKHGTLYLKLFWCQLSSSPPPRLLSYADEWKTTNRPVHSHLMVVFIDNVKDLPFPKSNVEPSPILEVSLATVKQLTPVKVRTTNPIYQSKFLFLIKESSQKELQTLDIKAIDSNTNKSLGELSIPLSSIIEQPEMEVFDKVFSLKHGAHTASITLTIRIRHIIPPNEVNEIDLSSYANSSYVERAQRTENHHSNGDVFAPEPGKQPETDPEHHPEAKTQLNTSRFTSINRRPSDVSNSSSKQTPKGLKNKLLRFRKPKSKRSSITDLGTLEYALRYNQNSSILVLDIISAHGLIPHSVDGKLSPYVSVKLVQNTPTGQLIKAKRRTNIIENTSSPVFDGRFEFDLKTDDFPKSHLMVTVKDNVHGLLAKSSVLGQAEIPLTNFSRTDSLRHKVNLLP